MDLLPLTLLLGLRAANVSLPPFLGSWCHYSVEYLDELHLLLCTESVGTDLLKRTNDFATLERGAKLLKEAWSRYLRRYTVPAQAVRCLLTKLARREEQSRLTYLDIRHRASCDCYDLSPHEWSVAQQEVVQCLHENYAMFLQDSDVATASGVERRKWGRGVLQLQAGVEVDLPLPAISQDELELILTYWTHFEVVSWLL